MGALVIVRPPAMVIVNALVVLIEMASVTCAVKLKVPELVGVPLMVAPLGANPTGNVPEMIDQV